MAGHARLKFVMTECSKTQIRLTGLNYGKNFLYMSKPMCKCFKSYASLINLNISTDTKKRGSGVIDINLWLMQEVNMQGTGHHLRDRERTDCICLVNEISKKKCY